MRRPVRFDLRRDLVDERLAASGGDDVGAGVGEPERERPADAAGAADDDGDAAGQIEHRRAGPRGCLAKAAHQFALRARRCAAIHARRIRHRRQRRDAAARPGTSSGAGSFD